MTVFTNGTRVRLTKPVDNFPDCLIAAGETGTFLCVDSEGAYWIELDVHHPELDAWNNELQIWDWSGQDGPDYHPSASLGAI